jgi:hypothetical protein
MTADPYRMPASVTFASRRGAGVWTNLPSLTAAMLSRRAAPGVAIWFDLGMRYEMLNHLGIAPSAFPAESTLAGIAEAMAADVTPTADGLLEFSSLVLGSDGAGTGALSRVLGPGGLEYRASIAAFAAQGCRIYVVPLQAPTKLALGADLPDRSKECQRAIRAVVDTIQPEYTFLTCEGQPEAGLLGAQVASNTLLRWALEVAEIILCLVRHDSDQRFEDGIAIPALLSRHAGWRDRLRIVQTRAGPDIDVPPELGDVVLGHVPFSEFVGLAVSTGRVPVHQARAQGLDSSGDAAESMYLRCIDELAVRLAAALAHEGNS